MTEFAPEPPQSSVAPQQPGLLEKLGSLFRTYAIPKESLVVKPPFAQDDRNCFTLLVPAEWPSDEGGASAILLLEDGQALGPPHATHDDIRALGKGRYSHWGPKIYFSSSDNSDPNGNGRVYSVIAPNGWSGKMPAADGTLHRAQPAQPRRALPGDRVSVEWIVTDLDPASMRPLAGNAYLLAVPGNWPSDRESLSTLILLEDGKPLPYPHAAHGDIQLTGRGRYSHWAEELRFSSLDNSDPRGNGRRYALARADAFLVKHAPQPPAAETGHAWVLEGLPIEWPSDVEGGSRLLLLENGRLLGPARSSHEDIRAKGSGLYSHWGRQLWFSTSDNTDPNTNGRTYTVVWPRDEEGAG